MNHYIEFIVDRLHVGCGVETVEAIIRARIDRANGKGADITVGQTTSYVRHALRRHRSNGKLYARVMGGRI